VKEAKSLETREGSGISTQFMLKKKRVGKGQSLNAQRRNQDRDKSEKMGEDFVTGNKIREENDNECRFAV